MSDGFWELDIVPDPRLWCPGELVDSAGIVYDDRLFGRGVAVDLHPPLRLPVAPFGESQREVTHPLCVTVAIDGDVAGLTFTNFGAPIAAADVADSLKSFGGEGVQRVGVGVLGRDVECDLVNVTLRIDCIDSVQSTIDWGPVRNNGDGLSGRTKYISRLVIHPEAVGKAHIFRPAGWEVALIVSTPLMHALREVGIRGVGFERVC